MPSPATLLVISHPGASYLKHLAKLPESIHLVVGNTLEIFERAAPEATIALNCFLSGAILREVFLRAPKLQWVHSLSVGVDALLFPELVDSNIPLTNSRGLFAEALGEFAIAGLLHFAKDLRRMLRQQAERKFDAFDIQMLSGKTIGIVGYGAIGRACAWRAKALGMRVLAVRRRPELSAGDPHVDQTYSPAQLHEMLAQCDDVVISSALTPDTRGMIGEAELAHMKPTSVIVNIGRGPVIVESALVRALQEKQIHGAVLDVFDNEPLPEDHPFWSMENVLLSPHCADHTDTWLDDAMQFFIENFHRFRNGIPLGNLVDKHAGY